MVFRSLFAAFVLVFMSATPQAGFAKTTPVAQSPRQTTDLSTGWRFRYGDAPVAVSAAGFDDSDWEQVSIPHSWNRIGEYATERSSATNNKQGVGYYRLTFNAPAAAKGKRQYLDFAAVSIIADVWVNGVHVGQHKGAFSRFRFDVTSAWKPGSANVIVVKADNSKPAIGSSTQDVLPLAGDFFIHGGIYRGVQLITANDVGIDLLDFGGPGVYVSASSGPSGTATVSVIVKLNNSTKRAQKRRLLFQIYDSERLEVASAQRTVTIRPGQSRVEMAATIGKPHFWNGTNDPYLYEVIAGFEGETSHGGIDGEGDIKGFGIVTEANVPLGIRTFKFDPDNGFSLNGKPLKLHGVSRHQDREGKGYALSRADHKQDMDLIAEMGANAVRMAHYQHDDAWADEADAHGMIAWAEVPFVTTPSFTGGEGSAEVFANAEQQTRELIRQNYNHPSIMMWSVGNEVDASTLFGVSKEPVKPLKLLQHIARIAKEEDPSRPTIFADCCEDVRSPVVGLDAQVQGEALAGAADMIGYNRYYGWYYPETLKAAAQLGSQMDKFHAKHPTRPIAISEYGAGGATGQHSDNPTSGFVSAIGRPQPEEYESWVHEQSWPVIRDRPFIFGSYVWNMFDFASDLRNEGDSVDINTKGLVTFDRKTKKDAFYYYQAQWTTDPMVHITSPRYTDRAYRVTDVRVYSNAPSVALSIDGVDLGRKTCEDRLCVWPNVALKPGPNRVLAVVSTGSQVVADSVIWNGPYPAKDGIHLDAGDIAGRQLGTRRFGSDTFVTGGKPAVLNQGGFGGRGAPKKTVTAPDPALYDYWREGEAFSYAIPVPDGQWTVTIHTFEPQATNSAVMAVSANGKPAFPAFNVLSAAGGSLKGLSRSFPVTVTGGVLKLDFSAAGGKVAVAAIEITPR
jgi:beta-galactosidase